MKALPFLALLSLAAVSTRGAASPQVGVELGPFYGRGTMDHGADVIGTGGVSLGATALLAIGERFAIGPRLELMDQAVHATGREGAAGKVLSNYNHRIAALGVTGSLGLSGAQEPAELVASLTTGQGSGRLQVDQSTASTFASSEFDGIRGV